ncbi:nuclear transport factor 2 family protein [Plantibacter flavus]|uniref:YybH family protein n=1 Tax=Plantibacter flavus TaxID=150123 RepID=UPI003F15D678
MPTPITELSSLPLAFADRFNAGDVEALLDLFAPDAVFVPAPGVTVSGDGVREALNQFLAIGLPFNLTPVRVLQSGATGLIIADWTIEGDAPDGSAVSLAGRTADVAIYDGVEGWRYAIDNPFGTV